MTREAARRSSLLSLRNGALVLLLPLILMAAASTTANSSAQASDGHTCEAQYDTAGLVVSTEVDGRGDHHGQASVGTAILAVSVFRFAETTPDGKGQPAGEGVYLFVDGKHLANADANGQALLTVPAGTVSVQAILPSTAIAGTTVEVPEGATVPLQLILDDSKEVASPIQLSVSGMAGDVLPSTFDSFIITLLDNGAPRAAAAVAEVALEDDLGNTLVRLTDDFQVDALGRLEPVNLAVIANAMAKYPGRELVLRVAAEDALGFTLLGVQSLYLGQSSASSGD